LKIDQKEENETNRVKLTRSQLEINPFENSSLVVPSKRSSLDDDFDRSVEFLQDELSFGLVDLQNLERVG